MKLKTLLTTILFASLFTSLAANAAEPLSTLVIDDFTQGSYRIELHSDSDRATQFINSSTRSTYIRVYDNPADEPLSMDMSKQDGAIVSSGYGVKHELFWSYASNWVDTAPAPLHWNLSGYEKFRVKFASLNDTLYVHVLVYTSTGVVSGYKLVNAYPREFNVDFTISDMIGAENPNFADVYLVQLQIVSRSITGGNDYKINEFSAIDAY